MKFADAYSKAENTASEAKVYEGRGGRESHRRGSTGFSLCHVQLPNRVHGAGTSSDAAATGHPGAVPGHRISLRRDVRISRSHGGAIGAESRQSAAANDRGGTRRPVRNPVSKRTGPLLRH